MPFTAERMSKLSVVFLFLFVVLAIGGAVFLITGSFSLGVGLATITVSAILVIFYSQEIGTFSIFLFAIIAILVMLVTLNAEHGFLAASVVVGIFIIYSLTR